MKIPQADPLAHISRPAGRRLAFRVTPAGQRALRGGHPWLFAEAVTHQGAGGEPGDLAVIFDDRRDFLAIGLYDPTSQIRVRVLQHGTPAAINVAWLGDRLQSALALRSALPDTGTTGYRMVHGENDGLAGLVIDRYDATLVVKLYSLAWVRWLPDLRGALQAICPAERVVLRLSRDLCRHPEYLYGLADGATLSGPPPVGPVLFSENGLTFEADVLRGQKTGFFLDQRDNRARAATLADGRRTLNVFAYSGAFSVYAARGGAPEVLSVDSSEPALEAVGRNFAHNSHIPTVAASHHVEMAADAFATMASLRDRGQRFGLVIVDPPSFAKRQSEADRALHSYARLTTLALGVLEAGGTLVIASCSSRVEAPAFYATVTRAAEQSGRPLHQIGQTDHPLDHPVRFPEGAYLKCLFATAP